MTKIKFGTDGWRAIIAKDFTTENVARVSLAVSEYINEKKDKPSVVIGYDCRFNILSLLQKQATKILASNGVKVFLSNGFVSTPMVSLGVVNYKADIGIVITASHNPPSYNGYKLKGDFGGPLLPKDISIVESKIPKLNTVDIDSICLKHLENISLLEYVNLEDDYCNHAENSFDLESIRKSNLKFSLRLYVFTGKML